MENVYLQSTHQLEVDLPLFGSELICVVNVTRTQPVIDSPAESRTLIPSRTLEPGEQYRFHFDMTKCIGCKCCVVACNEQNGNPAAINWRRVGELEGGHYPCVQRHYLSMGCNHCLEPSCLIGCPVEAYRKDPATGVVLHDPDTCIGCQYCTWNCSYGVPQYNAERGVVGKCDLCHNRLADDLAPACVAACPEGAIAVEIVNIEDWRRDYLSANAPGLPSADDSISTTRVTLPHDLPPDTGRVDTQRIVPEHPHWPLVFMLVLTQLAAGAVAVLSLLNFLDPGPTHPRALIAACMLAGISLGTATFHLGRPIYAWRALKGLRRSWLSREVLSLSIFAGTAVCYTTGALLQLPVTPVLSFATVLSGLIGVLCSARLYMVPARPAWCSRFTIPEFLATAALLGPLLVCAIEPESLDPAYRAWLLRAAAAGGAAQLVIQTMKFLWLSRSEQFELRASALLLSGRLQNRFLIRLGILVLAGIVLPLTTHSHSELVLALALGGEWLGRWLFFVSVVPKNIAAAFTRSGELAA